MILNREIISTLAVDGELRLFQKFNDAGAVPDASGDDFRLHRSVNRREHDFSVFAQPPWNVDCPSAGGVVGAAETMPDVHHPFPRIENVVVFDVMIDADVLASLQFGFYRGDVVVGPDFRGFGMPLVRVPDNQNIQRVRFQAAPDQGDKLVQNPGFVGGRNLLLETQRHAAIGLGKPGRLNQPPGLPCIANHDLGRLVTHLVFHRRVPALERLENHNLSMTS